MEAADVRAHRSLIRRTCVSTTAAWVSSIFLGAWVFIAPAFGQTAAGGSGHTVILKSGGTVWTIGLNTDGQLGDNTTTTRQTPIQVNGLSNIVAVAAGKSHTMALTDTGVLYVWGDNASGQVGDGTTTDRKTPVESNLTSIVAIAAGENHSVALKSNGDVYTWGSNSNGQLGDGTTTNSTTPIQVVTGGAAIGAGSSHTLFVKTNGTVYATGKNANGQLGDASTTQRTSPVQMSGITTAIAAVGGAYHSIVLLSGGTLKATGLNSSGQLGDGTLTQRTSPVAVSNLTNITAIAGGLYHTVALESDGTVWAWGANSYGEVGDGTTNYRSTAVELTSLSSITKIGAGNSHSIAVSSSGVVYTWGRNADYQLGDGTNVNRLEPTAISDASYDWKVSTPVLSVAAGTYNTDRTVTITVTTSGSTIHYTQSGIEPTESDPTITSGNSVTVNYSQTLKAKAWKSGMPPSNTASAVYTMKVGQPTLTPGTGTYGTAQTVTMSTVTTGATIRYTTDGSTPTTSSTAYSSAISVGTTTTVKAIGFKTDWSDSDLRTATYTMNFGTLSAPTADQATGTYTNSVTVTLSAMTGATIRYTTNGSTPTASSTAYTAPLVFDVTTTLKAKAFHPDYTTSAETARTYTIALGAPTLNPTSGTYTAGQQITVTAPITGTTMRYSLNGLEPTTSDPEIVSGGMLVAGNYTLKVKAWKTGATDSPVSSATYAITGSVATAALAAGATHTLALRSDGVVFGFGDNGSGQLGDGTTTDRLLPRLALGLTGIVSLAAGGSHSFAKKGDGSVAAFGYRLGGRLGDGTTTGTSPTPTFVSALAGLVALEGGADHSVGLKSDGTVQAWGTNGNGQVGDGTTTNRSVPTAVASLTSVAAIGAGDRFSLAVKQDGTAWAWGYNSSGQLGDGTTTQRTSPVQVSGLSTATAIAGGQLHSLALLSDGTVRAWGSNAGGQLGDGTTTQRTTPVQVDFLSNITAIAAGADFSLALESDGTVWAWGANGSGQLGDGTTTNRTSAAQISGLSNIVQIAAGLGHALALASDGTVWAWGYNLYGQLGDGTTTNRLTPVAISGAGMNWRVPTPLLSVASGLYYANQTVTVTVSDPDATLRYTTTGVDPTSSDPTIASGGTISITQSQTLKVSGWKTGALTSLVATGVYELKVVTPTMTPGAGSYGSSQSVSISTTTSGATIRYTLDGTEPSTSSTTYSSALTVADTLTLKARAYKTGWTASDSGHASYWVMGGTVATPTITPSGGAQTSPPLVSMSTTTSGATVRYTLDGSTPTAASTPFVYPFLISATTTLKAKAFRAGFNPSAVASVTYEVDASGATATPSIVPAGGTFATKQTVTITGASGATLRYTTDGSDPTTSSTTIASGGTLTINKSQSLKVRAWATGLNPSAVRRADFIITGIVAAGVAHSLAIDAEGVLWGWGGNGLHQLGDGTITTRLTPIQVMTGAMAAGAGERHSLAVKTDGTVWGWGDSQYGKLGNGASSGAVSAPAQIASFSGVVAVAAGYSHSLALKSDGTVWAFGNNSDGQLGDGTTTQRTTPVQVVGLTGVVAIAAGRDTSYALQTDSAGGGIIWAWGANSYGQLGDGSTLSRTTPTRVTGLGSVAALAAGFDHAAAVAVDGRVFSWGQNDNGQLGLGTTANQTSAQEVRPLLDVRVMGAGGQHTFAVDATARAWGWGQNGGQLGTGEIVAADSVAPERSNLGGALAVAGGDQHTLAIVPDGTVRAFGQNGSGRLGNGNTLNTGVPQVVSGLSLADNAWLTSDADADGLVTWREYLLGTDPLNPDSNGNGIPDGLDEASGLSAANPDLDGDGVANWTELALGTDPFSADSDGDTYNDLVDAFPLDPARHTAPSGNPSDTTPPVITLTQPVSACLVPCSL
jgi:alpha-tubulin suppressor-like RCC1 family protein